MRTSVSPCYTPEAKLATHHPGKEKTDGYHFNIPFTMGTMPLPKYATQKNVQWGFGTVKQVLLLDCFTFANNAQTDNGYCCTVTTIIWKPWTAQEQSLGWGQKKISQEPWTAIRKGSNKSNSFFLFITVSNHHRNKSFGDSLMACAIQWCDLIWMLRKCGVAWYWCARIWYRHDMMWCEWDVISTWSMWYGAICVWYIMIWVWRGWCGHDVVWYEVKWHETDVMWYRCDMGVAWV